METLMRNTALIASGLAVLGCGLIYLSSKQERRSSLTETQYAQKAVSITSPSMRAGGTGVVLQSFPNSSLVLTNKHVCELIQVGGLVNSDTQSYPVDSFRVYTKHDLCAVIVRADLHAGARLASNPPAIYHSLTVPGHPALLPTMVSKGHFSGRSVITMMVDTEECDGTETSADIVMMCILMGAKPVLQSFDAQATSALIMPGSSGSGVFNEDGELSGLVFAGSQGLSYGFIVPHEYVVDFLSHITEYPTQTPNPKAKPRNFFTALIAFQGFCDAHTSNKLCKLIKNQSIWYY